MMRRSEFRPSGELLLASNDHDTLELYTIGLEQDGFTVFATPNAMNAAAFLEAGRPPNALVVVGSLRGEDAWAWIEPLFARAAAAHIPIVLVTPSVHPDGRYRRRALVRGCAAFVAQPCTPGELSVVVRRVIAGDGTIVVPPLLS